MPVSMNRISQPVFRAEPRREGRKKNAQSDFESEFDKDEETSATAEDAKLATSHAQGTKQALLPNASSNSNADDTGLKINILA